MTAATIVLDVTPKRWEGLASEREASGIVIAGMIEKCKVIEVRASRQSLIVVLPAPLRERVDVRALADQYRMYAEAFATEALARRSR